MVDAVRFAAHTCQRVWEKFAAKYFTLNFLIEFHFGFGFGSC